MCRLSSTDNNIIDQYESNGIVNNEDVFILKSFTERINGQYTAVDFSFDGTYYDGIIYYEFEVNGNEINVNSRKLDVEFKMNADDQATLRELHIAWSEDGQTGFIMFIAGIGTCTEGINQTYMPSYLKTNDGGVTWTNAKTINLNNFTGFIEDYKFFNIDTIGNSIETGLSAGIFDADLVIAQGNEPYFLLNVTALGYDGTDIEPYTIYSSADGSQTPYVMVLLHYDNDDENWELIKVTDIESPESLDFVPDFSNHNGMYLSYNEDRSDLFITYMDAPLNLSLNEAYRDLRGIQFNVNDQTVSEIIEFTANDPVWAGEIRYFTASQNVIDIGNNDYRIPVVTTEILTDNYGTVQYHYLQDIDFNEGLNFSSAEIANPTVEEVAVLDMFNAVIDSTMFLVTGEFNAIEDSSICSYFWYINDSFITDGTSLNYTFEERDSTYNVCLEGINDCDTALLCENYFIPAIADTVTQVTQVNGWFDGNPSWHYSFYCNFMFGGYESGWDKLIYDRDTLINGYDVYVFDIYRQRYSTIPDPYTNEDNTSFFSGFSREFFYYQDGNVIGVFDTTNQAPLNILYNFDLAIGDTLEVIPSGGPCPGDIVLIVDTIGVEIVNGQPLYFQEYSFTGIEGPTTIKVLEKFGANGPSNYFSNEAAYQCVWDYCNAYDNVCYRNDALNLGDDCNLPVVNIEEFESEQFSIHPNPTNGIVIIDLNYLQVEKIEVYNSLGQTVISKFSSGLANEIIDLTGYENGLYFISVITKEKEVFNQKVILNR